ncbi:UPF0182 family membrane protein [Actinoallomurus rhizosphaericola]|uniref:UPF0182 family membrane protein n=1 Tax=Actinoallomurus rhizosphaericola TaxID=2952536 RepID=UPI002092441F|nr:UPF0182 family protein [Actinoallomurus rhizosphaericola]MCO5999923.1 UPF0182 family protein [Actinoallomurus rhizosphaericola]
MSFRSPGSFSRIRVGRSRLLARVIVILAILVALFFAFTAIWTDVLWYRSVGFSAVYTTQITTRVTLFLCAGLLMILILGANVVIAYRLRPPYRPASVEQQGLDRYRAAVDPHRRLLLAGVLTLAGLLAGSSAAGRWRTWLAFVNRQPFHVKDPQFHKDISFFVFTYPLLRLVLGFLFAAVILAFVAALIVHYLYGGLRLQGPGERVGSAARAHLSVLFGVFVLLKAVAYWFDRWGLADSHRGVVTGPSYTDVNAVLPAKTILAVIALICALMFFATLVRRGAMLPGMAFGLLVLSAILIGGVYPLLIQTFQVKPNEVDKEAKYIGRNIVATRQAYGVADTQVTDYVPNTKLSPEQAKQETSTLPNVRLLDPAVVSPTYQQLQQIKGWYKFPNPLDIDRYPGDDGSLRDTVVAVREIAGPPSGQNNWINNHLVYTHGYGFVAAPGNQVDAQGAPVFTEKDIPPTGSLNITQPRVYFGERSPGYSIVGGTEQREVDYPDDKSPSGQTNTAYDGKGGVPIGSLFDRTLYALRFKEKNLLLSGAINSRSRILYDRTPRERVQKAAPWLKVDGNPYPAVVGGRIVWIVDGYTTATNYPYSEGTSLADATRDTNTESRVSVAAQAGDRVNYMRNSVKATVDAYDGTVTLYAWDEKDPVLKTWMKAFPGTVRPRSAIPNDLLAHLRYPEDLFKVQRGILARYHVQNPQAFYGGGDFWQIPDDPTGEGTVEPPYYLSVKMPGATDPGFSLTSTFTPKGKVTNLTAFMAVDSVPTSPTYGRIRILQVPRSQVTPGPEQVQNTFENNPTVSQQLTLLRGPGSRTVSGNLLTLPFGGGFLYVEPVYLQANSGGGAYPLLKRVLVSYGNDIGFGATLQDALGQVLGGGAAATTGPPLQANEDIRAAIDAANRAYGDAQTALKNNDWAGYGEAQKRLKTALDELARLQKQSGARPAPTTSATPRATATPATSPPTAPTPTPKPTR